jgi:hypothetical protein
MGESIGRREADLERREADLERRETEVTAREAALAKRMEDAHEILAAADERDVAADARDAAADKRESDFDLARMLASPGEGDYGSDWPERRNAGVDRHCSKEDRAASHDDRIRLTENSDVDDPDRT